MFAPTTITPHGAAAAQVAGGGSSTERATTHGQDQCVARGARDRRGYVPHRLRFVERQQQLQRFGQELGLVVLLRLRKRVELLCERDRRRQGCQGRDHPPRHHV